MQVHVDTRGQELKQSNDPVATHFYAFFAFIAFIALGAAAAFAAFFML
jgi:hypothetical protein